MLRLLGVFVMSCLPSLGCVEFEAGPPAQDLPTDDDDDDDDDDEQPVVEAGSADDGTSLPAAVVAALPDSLPQEFIEGGRLGDECSDAAPCRAGLNCDDEVCVAEGQTELGDHCILSLECAEGQCVDNVCAPFGDGQERDHCLSAAECGPGLRCGVVNLSTQCIPAGDVAMGGECASSNDCAAGLACVSSQGRGSMCSPAPGAPAAVPEVWPGVECEEPSEDDIRAYFEIPGAPDAEEFDYFRLPFPNDVLMSSSGRVEVSDFPTPGVSPVVGVDPIAPYVRAIDGSRGWGTNGTVTFRFSGRIDLDSFNDGDGAEWADITDPESVRTSGIRYKYFSGRTNYVCHNMLSVRRSDGSPMEPGHTYAIWLSSIGRTKDGDPIERSPNFEAMLRNAVPSDATLAAAHERYAPFRAYLEAQEIDPDDVLVASVVTVGPVREPMADLAASVLDTEVPTASDWVLCDGESESPCPQAEGSRACGDGDSTFDEYHGLVELPIFQEGTPPYMEEGGSIDSSGPVRSEEVCLSLTVPKGEQPADGWPLVVYAHGTGGSFRGHVTNTAVARALTNAVTPDGEVSFAVLGYDQVQHGPRRGDSEESPENLFFNFLNPAAARGNPLQGAADVISMGRFAASLDISPEESGDAAISIDPERIVFFGHSQGSMHGSLGLPYSPHYKATVLSGHGASLMHSLLSKTEPVNIKSVVPLVVSDGVEIDLARGIVAGSLPQEDHHPVLSLIQQHIDPADPLNFALQISRQPVGELPPKHVFQTYGLNDSYSPPQTMAIFAKAADLSVVQAHSSAGSGDDLGEEESEFPFASSFTHGPDNTEYTAGVRQYGPSSDDDGHFVVFDVEAANEDALRFLGMSVSGQTPQIGE